MRSAVRRVVVCLCAVSLVTLSSGLAAQGLPDEGSAPAVASVAALVAVAPPTPAPTVATAYTLDLTQFNPGADVERSACVTAAIRANLAYECGDLRLTYALQAKRFRNQVRAPALLYNSQFARPTPIVRVAVSPTAAWPGAPISVTATLKVQKTPGGPFEIRSQKVLSGAAQTGSLATGQASQVAFAFDATDLPTNLYPIQVDFSMDFGGGAALQNATVQGDLAIVNRKGSEFGAGWWVAGYERLQRLPDGSLFWVGGDGSTRRYTRQYTNSANVTVYTARALTGLDSLSEWPDATFRRHMSRGAYVHFTSAGRHDQTVSSLGAVTRFESELCTFLTRITLVPSGAVASVGQSWGFWYVGYDADDPCAVYNPADPAAWYDRVNTMTGSNNSVWRFWYPDSGSFMREYGANWSTAEKYAYTEQNGRIRTYRDAFGTETRIGYDLATGTIVSDTIMLDLANVDPTKRYVIHTYRAGEAAAVALPLSVTDATTRLRGPRASDTTGTTLRLGAFGQPTRIVNPLGHATQLTYSATFPLLATKVVAPNGYETYATYDALGRVTDVGAQRYNEPDAYVAVTRYAYDPAPQFADLLVTSTDPTGVVTRYGYDGPVPSSARYPLLAWQQVGNDTTRRTRFGYCQSDPCAGLLASVTSPVNGANFRRSTDTYEYDTYGNLSATQSAGGKRVEYRNDNFYGRVAATKTRIATSPSARWITDTVAYDYLGRLVSTLTSAAAEGPTPDQYLVASTEYVGASTVPRVVRRYANTTVNTIGVLRDSFTYDAIGRVREKFAQGASRTVPEKLMYDAAGNVIQRITPTGDTVTMTYDALHRLSVRTATSVTYDYERVGSAAFTLTDPLRSPAFPRLALGVQPLVVDRDRAEFTYDDDGTKTGQLRTANNRASRISRTYYPNGWVQTDTQRLSGVLDTANFSQHVYGIGYVYDDAGRRTALNHPLQLASGFSTWQEATAYSTTTGLPLWTRDLSMQATAFTYDGSEQLTRQDAPGGIARVAEYSLDGELATDRVLNGSTNAGAPLPNPGGSLRNATLGYDARGKLTGITDNGGLPFTMATTYTPFGQLRSSSTSSYAFDANGSLVNQSTASSITTDALGHTLVSSGSTSSATYSATFGSGSSGTVADPRTNQFAPDGSGQMVLSFTSVGRDSTRYDANGNVRLQLSRDSARTQPNGPIPETSERAHYYDGLGQLVAVDARKAPTAPNGTDPKTYRLDHYLLPFDSYRYDALGRRVQSRSQRACPADSDFGAECRLGSVQRTVWDGSRELWEIRMPDSVSYVDRDSLLPTSIGLIDQSSPVVLRLDLSPHFGRVGYVYGGAIDRPLAVMRADYGDRGWYNPGFANPQSYKRFQPFTVYPQWDQRGEPGLGSTTDGGAWPCEGAGASKRCTYPMPWSGLWGPNGVAFLSTSRVWVGSLVRDKREANGLLFRRNRYLDPATGRFTQPDPIGLAGGLNSYGFAEGDPVNYADPFGLNPCLVPVVTPLCVEGAEAAAAGAVTVAARAAATPTGQRVIASSAVLARNMMNSGVVRGVSTHAHHIVAGASRFAAASRAKLADLTIEINEAANGVFVPAASHLRMHTKAMYEAVEKAIMAASTREEGLEVLRDLADKIARGVSLHP